MASKLTFTCDRCACKVENPNYVVFNASGFNTIQGKYYPGTGHLCETCFVETLKFIGKWNAEDYNLYEGRAS
jgi:hypothetical protein